MEAERAQSPPPPPAQPSPPRAVVIDMGAGTCKVGFAGGARPSHSVASVLGCRPAGRALDAVLGEAARARPELALVRPLRHGVLLDWDAAALLWRHLLEHDLRAAPRDHPLLFADAPFSPATQRERLLEVAFEALRAPAAHVAAQPVLAAYAHGRVSALVADAGHALCSVVPVLQGHALPHAAERLDVAGSHLTAFLAEALRGAGAALRPGDLAAVEAIKHRHCAVAAGPEEARAAPARPRPLRLPDGRTVALGAELAQCPELLFQPPAAPGLAPVGLPAMARRSLARLPVEAGAAAAANVLLCGGSSLFAGFEARFRADLQRARPPGAPPLAVLARPDRGHAVWTGGSILASLRAFRPCWVRREQYEEQGPQVVYRQCW